MSRAGSSSTNGSALPKGVSDGWYFVGIVVSSVKEDDSVNGSHSFVRQRSAATSATVSLTQLNSAGAGDDPKGSRVRRYAIPFKIEMLVMADIIAAWMRRYAESRSVLLWRIGLLG